MVSNTTRGHQRHKQTVSYSPHYQSNSTEAISPPHRLLLIRLYDALDDASQMHAGLVLFPQRRRPPKICAVLLFEGILSIGIPIHRSS